MRAGIFYIVGDFTWDFGQNFFIETSEGNFLWSCPDYGGNDTIRPYNGMLQDYFSDGTFGRDKGEHIIGEYCPTATFEDK